MKRASFGSRFGALVAMAGSAVGLGNLWRFPYLAAKYGGGIFILVYLVLAITFGFTLMITEIAIGRKTGVSAVGAFKNLDKRFGFVGRINPIKNIDLLLEAWAKLGNKTENCELIIAGEGDAIYKKQLTDFVADKKLTNVVFCGFLSGNELTEMVSSFDYQLLVSKSENFGMVIPEALICGVPCIATQGTPWGELNTHNCGWWINDGVDNIASAIENAISTSETTRKEMGLRGRQLVIDNYSVNAVADKLIKVYEKIL